MILKVSKKLENIPKDSKKVWMIQKEYKRVQKIPIPKDSLLLKANVLKKDEVSCTLPHEE